MKTRILPLIVAAFVVSLCELLQAADLEPLPVRYPPPNGKGPLLIAPSVPGVEPPLNAGMPPQPFMAPRGVTNVALGKKVTAQGNSVINGRLDFVTDGKKGCVDDFVVEMRPGLQWVQIDLRKECEIAAIAVWHDYRYHVVAFHDVILQVSNDPTFTTNVVTLFNNDSDNSAGQGAGKDKEYWEQYCGRIIDGKMTKARYVRSYTNGSLDYRFNCVTEIEVYALP